MGTATDASGCVSPYLTRLDEGFDQSRNLVASFPLT